MKNDKNVKNEKWFQNVWNEQMAKNRDESYETQSEYYDSESKRSRRQKTSLKNLKVNWHCYEAKSLVGRLWEDAVYVLMNCWCISWLHGKSIGDFFA